MPRTLAVVVLAVALSSALSLADAPAIADSWAAPQEMVAVSPDGRWYVLAEPTAGLKAKFRLIEVTRGRSAPKPRTSPRPQGDAGPTLPRLSDRVRAAAKGPMPVGIHCLSAGDGFVTFETYGQVGTATVAARYDRNGRQRWSRKLGDFFSAAEIGGFRASSSSIWWFESHRLDEKNRNLVVVYETPKQVPADAEIRGPNLGPRRVPGVLRIALETGRRRPGNAQEFLALLELGSPAERTLAIDAVVRARPRGWKEALVLLVDRESEDLGVRVAAAIALHRAGDPHGVALIRQAAGPETPTAVRAEALEALPAVLGEEAWPFLQAALREEDPELGMVISRAFRNAGVDALDVLIEMANDADAPDSYRVTAIQVLALLGEPARRALPTLARAARAGSAGVAENARNAMEAIRNAMAAKR